MIPLYPCLDVMFFKFFCFVFFQIMKYFCGSLFFNDKPYLAKLRQRKVTTRSGGNFMWFCFCFIWNLVYMRKGNQPRIYVDLLRFQSKVKDPINIIILEHNITFSFILSMFLNLFTSGKKITEYVIYLIKRSQFNLLVYGQGNQQNRITFMKNNTKSKLNYFCIVA